MALAGNGGAIYWALRMWIAETNVGICQREIELWLRIIGFYNVIPSASGRFHLDRGEVVKEGGLAETQICIGGCGSND